MFVIKGSTSINQFKILNKWLEDNFVDGSVRAIFTENNHAKIIDQRGGVIPVEIQDGKVIDYDIYHSQKAKKLEDMIAEAISQQKKATKDISQTYKYNDFKSMNSKFDLAIQSGDTVLELVKERTNLRLEGLRKKQWDRFLGNDDWIPMEQPHQLSPEYFDNPDIKQVILQYQLDKEAMQEIIANLSYKEKTPYEMPDRFYLGKVNGSIELIVGESFMDNKLFHFSSNATRSYELSGSTLKDIANNIYNYDDMVAFTVDDRQEVNEMNNLYEGAVEKAVDEAMAAAEIPEPDFEMEL